MARERREDVRAAWVVLSDSRRGATEEGELEGRAVVVLEVRQFKEAWRRLRRVDSGEESFRRSMVDVGGEEGVGGRSPYSARRSSELSLE